jgi:chromosome segregation ATPase
MNPFDALLVSPSLIRRALDDVHDIARLVRRYAGLEEDILRRVELLEADLRSTRQAVEPLSDQLSTMQRQLTDLAEEVEPIQNLAPIRRGIEPLDDSMAAVRASVDELEPMISEVHRHIRGLDPKLDEMQDSIDPIGDLAERIPGNRRRRGS